MNVARSFSFLLSFRLLVLVLSQCSSHQSSLIRNFSHLWKYGKSDFNKTQTKLQSRKNLLIVSASSSSEKGKIYSFFLSVACYSNNVTYQWLGQLKSWYFSVCFLREINVSSTKTKMHGWTPTSTLNWRKAFILPSPKFSLNQLIYPRINLTSFPTF